MKPHTAIDLIQGKTRSNAKEIAWNLFIDYHHQTSMFKTLYPEEYKRNIKQYEEFKEKRKRKKGNPFRPKWRMNSNSINIGFKTWKKNKFFDFSQSIPKNYKGIILLCKFNMNPFFEYFKMHNIDLTLQEKNIINFLFNPTLVRQEIYRRYKDEDFLTAIPTFYIANFYLPSIRPELSEQRNNFYKSYKDFSVSKEYLKIVINDDGENETDEKILREKAKKDFNVTLGTTKEKVKVSHDLKVIYKNYARIQPSFDVNYSSYDNRPYVYYYSLFHEYFDDIMKQLDEKMLKIIGLSD